jgi:hypothetical protein
MRAYLHIKDIPYRSKFILWFHLNIKFQTLYLLNQNIAIDESLTFWKGRLSIRQYLPLKASKFGIKLSKYANKEDICGNSLYIQAKTRSYSRDYSRHPQNSSCSTGTFRTLVMSWTLAVDWQIINSPELAMKVKIENSTLYGHTKPEQK